jgi:hypothetical protein
MRSQGVDKRKLSLTKMMMVENQSSQSQIHVTAILGNYGSLLRTQFKWANHACQRGGGVAVLTIYQSCDRGGGG